MTSKRHKHNMNSTPQETEEDCLVRWDDNTTNVVYKKEIQNVESHKPISIGSKIKMFYRKKMYYGVVLEITKKNGQIDLETKESSDTEDFLSTKESDYSPPDDTDQDPDYEESCEVVGCKDEVFSACHKCLALMCENHFLVCENLNCSKGHVPNKVHKGQHHEWEKSKKKDTGTVKPNLKSKGVTDKEFGVGESNMNSRTVGTQTQLDVNQVHVNRSTQTEGNAHTGKLEERNIIADVEHTGIAQPPFTRTSGAGEQEDIYQATRDEMDVARWRITETIGIEAQEKNKKNRRQYCIYCKKILFNLPRHLLRVHGDQDQVKEYNRMRDLGDKKMNDILGKLRREGNSEMNKVLKGLGKPIQPIRITQEKNPSVLKPCPNCGAYYKKRTLSRHYKTCSGKPVEKNFSSIVEGKQKVSEAKPFVQMSKEMRDVIIPGMRIGQKDEIIETIINDQDLIAMGNSLCLKFGHELETQKKLIRRKLRAMANLRVAMGKEDLSIKCIRNIFDTDKWETYINAVLQLAKLKNKEENRMSPNLVTEIGLLATNVARNVKVSLPKTATEETLKKSIEDWLSKHEVQFGSTIGYQARKLAERKRWQKRKYEPLTEDIILLNNYLREVINKAMEVLKITFDKRKWVELSKACMLLLLSFNRKRIGEVQNMTVADFERKQKVRENTDVYSSLLPSEKILASHFYHVQIRGKLARGVPILIEEGIAKAIDMLVSYREAAGVPSSNTFLFARGDGSNSQFEGNVCLADAADSCGAEAPEFITSTNLRKHLASVSQALNMTDNDLKTLSGFLGHTTKTHLEHYRLPSDALHTAKLSKLLLALDEGTISKYRGKSIEEIDVSSTVAEIEEDIGLSLERSSKISTVSKGQTRKTLVTTPIKLKTSVERMKSSRSPKKSPMLSPAAQRRRWTAKEIKAMRTEFADFISEERLPGTEFCRQVRRRCEDLRSRKVTLLRAWINNDIVKQRKLRRRKLFEDP